MILILDYIRWHFFQAPLGILRLAGNYLRATKHKFFIVRHIKTLFAPWHRMRAKYLFPPKKFSDRITNLLVEGFVRFVAALIRITIVLSGLVAEVFVAILFATIFVLWVLWLPILALALWIGITLIF